MKKLFLALCGAMFLNHNAGETTEAPVAEGETLNEEQNENNEQNEGDVQVDPNSTTNPSDEITENVVDAAGEVVED